MCVCAYDSSGSVTGAVSPNTSTPSSTSTSELLLLVVYVFSTTRILYVTELYHDVLQLSSAGHTYKDNRLSMPILARMWSLLSWRDAITSLP